MWSYPCFQPKLPVLLRFDFIDNMRPYDVSVLGDLLLLHFVVCLYPVVVVFLVHCLPYHPWWCTLHFMKPTCTLPMTLLVSCSVCRSSVSKSSCAFSVSTITSAMSFCGLPFFLLVMNDGSIKKSSVVSGPCCYSLLFVLCAST